MSTPRYEKTCAILKELGIDYNVVSIENLDTTGYSEIVLDESGFRVLTAKGRAKTVRREWPSLADGIRVIDQFIKDGGYKQ